MEFEQNKGTCKYSPNISAEKITETTSQAFIQMVRNPETLDKAIDIISNYIEEDEQ